MPFMPLFVKVSDWVQTPNNITIKIPSYGAPSRNVDVFTSDKYLKAHYGQHFLELFLWGLIDTSQSSCVITDKDIIFELKKWSSENWEKLEADIDKATKRELRKEIIEETQKKSKKEEEEKVNKNAELKRVAVREQIALDSKKHTWIKNVREQEKENALRALQLSDKHKSIREPPPKTEFKKSNDISKYKFSKHNLSTKDTEVVPQPRTCQNISVKFTEREFPTPQRESMMKEEEEWLTKQAAARRSAGFVKEDLRPEERNPQWLKAKGDQFFKDKNYLGAVSAYSEGINVSKNFVDLYINRSAAHFELGNMQRTIDDCSRALDIMTPAVPANADMRAKCIARRGAALCNIGRRQQGLGEFDAAIQMLNNNQCLRADVEIMKRKCIERHQKEV